MLDFVAMLIELVASFLGLVFRGVFGKTQHGNAAPDRPVNKKEIFHRSLLVTLVAALAISFFAMLASGSLFVAGIAFAVVFVIGCIGAFMAITH